LAAADRRCRLAFVERVAAAAAFNYRLVGEDGEYIGDFASVEGTWAAGDLVPFQGSIFEILAVDDATCSVRKVL
jgi:hypothetical protein